MNFLKHFWKKCLSFHKVLKSKSKKCCEEKKCEDESTRKSLACYCAHCNSENVFFVIHTVLLDLFVRLRPFDLIHSKFSELTPQFELAIVSKFGWQVDWITALEWSRVCSIYRHGKVTSRRRGQATGGLTLLHCSESNLPFHCKCQGSHCLSWILINHDKPGCQQGFSQNCFANKSSIILRVRKITTL